MWFVSIWAAVSGASLWAVHDASLIRGIASQRAELGTIAQSELEQARALPVSELKSGSFPRSDSSWPAGTSCTVTMEPQTSSTWLLDVQVSRKTARQIKPVRLTTVRRALP